MTTRIDPTRWPAFLDEATNPPACRGHDPETFFPEHRKGGPAVHVQASRAKAICAECPLLAPCREWAFEQSPTALHGIWGGTTYNDRRYRPGRRRGVQPPHFRNPVKKRSAS
ncbi:WhiB family transcriptional regulator [Micromonospora sp. NPDC050187]|uniref:WhiB family transcriptional regulator n=1 Tax=Micromonospora sp. NPDC050187 TaxID=3364277 RepID=UPI0037989E30